MLIKHGVSCLGRASIAGLAALLSFSSIASADVFNEPSGITSITMVTIGNPGNAGTLAASEVVGAVPYTYQMDEYDITAQQYCDFLNAVATTSDPEGVYSVLMSGTSVFNGENGKFADMIDKTTVGSIST